MWQTSSVHDGLNQLNQTINDMQSQLWVSEYDQGADGYLLRSNVIVWCRFCLGLFSATIAAIVAYGAVAAAVAGLHWAYRSFRSCWLTS